MNREARSLAWSAASMIFLGLGVATALAIPPADAPKGVATGLVAYFVLGKGCLVAAAKEAYN